MQKKENIKKAFNTAFVDRLKKKMTPTLGGKLIGLQRNKNLKKYQ